MKKTDTSIQPETERGTDCGFLVAVLSTFSLASLQIQEVVVEFSSNTSKSAELHMDVYPSLPDVTRVRC